MVFVNIFIQDVGIVGVVVPTNVRNATAAVAFPLLFFDESIHTVETSSSLIIILGEIVMSVGSEFSFLLFFLFVR